MIFRQKAFLFLFSVLFTGLYSPLKAQNHFSAHSKSVLVQLKPYFEGTTQSNKTVQPIPDRLTESLCVRKETNGNYALGGLIQIQASESASAIEQQLNRLHITVGTKAGNIWSVKIPLNEEIIQAFSTLKGIDYLDLDKRVFPALSKAKKDIGADKVHTGTGLPTPFKGNGVIVGMIDSGFDLGHPTFYDKNGNLRVKTWWDQGGAANNPPAGFSYGTNYPTAETMIQAGKDSSPIGHGSHTAGIATGSGDGTTELYTGIAPEADIVLVSFTDASSKIVDAAKYIFDYAESQNKPAVINMSLGTHDGPHDGTSLIDQAFKNLVGKGKILVGALGNEGLTPLHISHTFNGDTLRTLPTVAGFPPLLGQTTVDIWGEEDFKVGFVMLSPQSETPTEYIEQFYSPLSIPDVDSFSRTNGFEGTQFKITCSAPDKNPNKKGNVRVQFNSTYFFGLKLVGLRIYGKSGKIHMWNIGQGAGAPFTDTLASSQIVLADYTKGDFESSLREIGGTGEAVISVGAYTTMNEYTNVNGTKVNINMPAPEGAIAPFSSRGPAGDGRMKPDITAPGNVVASAFSSFDQFSPREAIVANVRKDNKDYPFGVYEGTSMAAPMVCGTVALMLQANKNLTPEEVKALLKKTARTDAFTGTIPTEGSNTWGWGKLNAYQAVLEALATSTEPGVSVNHLPFAVYPNPATNQTELILPSLPQPMEVEVTVSDILGHTINRMVFYHETGHQNLVLDTAHLPSGIYLLNVKAGSQMLGTVKLVVE